MSQHPVFGWTLAISLGLLASALNNLVKVVKEARSASERVVQASDGKPWRIISII